MTDKILSWYPLFYIIFIINPPPPSPWERLWTFREPQFCPRGLWIPPCVFLIRFNQGGNECFQPRLKWHRHKKTNYFPINSPMMAFEGSSEFFFQLQCHAWFELRETLWIRHKLQVIAPVFPDFLTNEAERVEGLNKLPHGLPYPYRYNITTKNGTTHTDRGYEFRNMIL